MKEDMVQVRKIMSSRKKAPRGSLCLPVMELGNAKRNSRMARSVQRKGGGCAPRREVKVWDPMPPGVVGAQCLHELKFMEEISIDSY